jgi:hypothetical protein
MSAASSTRPRAAATLLGISASLTVSGLVLGGINDALTLDGVAFALLGFSVQVVGALLIARQPRNAIGHLMGGLGLLTAMQGFVEGYVTPAVVEKGYPIGGVVLTWAMAHTYLFIFTAIGLLFFLFPTGSVSRPRWKPVVRLMLVGLLTSAVSLYFKPGRLDDEAAPAFDNPPNPYSLDGATDFLNALSLVGVLLLLGGVALSVVALVARFRSSEGIVRLQMKWFASAAACFAVILFVNLALRNFAELPAYFDVLLSFTFTLIPISIGNAILRYRLYEIDVFINRALVYALLTACVVGAYLSLVVILQAVLDPVTGDSDLAVAASTLAAAALFRPLRARIQSFIDHRFYRRKYDAAKAVSTFTSRLRDEVDLDVVRSDVLEVLRETVQPAHVGLWVRSRETA